MSSPSHSHGHGHDDGAVHAHVAPILLYIGVFAALICLTVLTVGQSYVDLGKLNLAVVVVIATIKASLVVGFFMHLHWDNKFNALILLSTVFFIAIFFVYTLNDTEHRGELDGDQNVRVLPKTGEEAPGGFEPPAGHTSTAAPAAAQPEPAPAETPAAPAPAPAPAPVPAPPGYRNTLSTGFELAGAAEGIEHDLIAFLSDAKRPVDKTTWFNFDRLAFKVGAAELEMEKSENQLTNIVEILKAFPKAQLKVGGYTDNTGDAATNKKLSQERAEVVMKELVSRGVDQKRLTAEGYGQEHPVCPANDTDECRAKNRRIAVRVTQK